uniref:Uncharacterized protein n=1 Tax=Romanomermis culicivorax TaxID=13658 RepID=A0A915LB87_ROMCU
MSSRKVGRQRSSPKISRNVTPPPPSVARKMFQHEQQHEPTMSSSEAYPLRRNQSTLFHQQGASTSTDYFRWNAQTGFKNTSASADERRPLPGEWIWMSGERSWVFVNLVEYVTVYKNKYLPEFLQHQQQHQLQKSEKDQLPTEKSCYSHSPPDMALAVYNWKRHHLTFETQVETLINRLQEIQEQRKEVCCSSSLTRSNGFVSSTNYFSHQHYHRENRKYDNLR